MDLDICGKLFQEVQTRDVASWIAAYTANGHHYEFLKLSSGKTRKILTLGNAICTQRGSVFLSAKLYTEDELSARVRQGPGRNTFEKSTISLDRSILQGGLAERPESRITICDYAKNWSTRLISARMRTGRSSGQTAEGCFHMRMALEGGAKRPGSEQKRAPPRERLANGRLGRDRGAQRSGWSLIYLARCTMVEEPVLKGPAERSISEALKMAAREAKKKRHSRCEEQARAVEEALENSLRELAARTRKELGDRKKGLEAPNPEPHVSKKSPQELLPRYDKSVEE
ncbi:hypothetical protein SELMODRAFT_423190 [Selaginella moellendorffii]|uniref:Uncharacterized protein n=1 Tax=Selaginella moellendorffii TaxID=88036 RepID=D8SKV5_SELML|nr:hypothetical protein SELMODRAFT_423190 [Selaginella moellendorffii]